MPENDTGIQLGGLADQIARSAGQGPPPVEQWNPPHCGDIGLAIAGDGAWSYRGSPIDRPGLVKLFASVLRKDADGRTYLVTPAEKIDIAVADAPFLAVEMEWLEVGSKKTLVFRTNVDDVVPCGPEHPLRFSVDAVTGAVKPYVHVRGRLEALLTRALTHTLLQWAVENEPAGVRSGGVLFLIPDLPN